MVEGPFARLFTLPEGIFPAPGFSTIIAGSATDVAQFVKCAQDHQLCQTKKPRFPVII